MNKTIRTICEIGIFAAIGFVLDELQGILFKGVFINGGSIGFAMIAVIIIAYRRGLLPALLTGLIMGGLDVATSAFIVHPAQLLLDYILPYAVVGFSGILAFFYKKADNQKTKLLYLWLGTLLGGIFKFFSHYIAGVIFWADSANFAWNLNDINPYLYCFIYNIAFIGPSIVLTGALLTAIYKRAPRLLDSGDIVISENIENEKTNFSIASTIIYSIGGLGSFIYFLIQYILSFSDYNDSGAYGYDFNPDYLYLTLASFMVCSLGIYCFASIKSKKFTSIKSLLALLLIVLLTSLFGLARMIRMIVKGKETNPYMIWVLVTSILLTIVVGLIIYSIESKKKKEN